MKIHSIKRKKEFANTLNHGKKFVKEACVFLYSNKDNQSDTKLGIIASKKTLRLAVQRNKARRRLRAAFRKAIVESNLNICGNFVLITRHKVLTEKFANIVNVFKGLIREL